MKHFLTSAFALTLVGTSLLAQTNWPQFRGPGARGVAEQPEIPDQWSSTKNVAKRVIPVMRQAERSE